MRTTSRTSKAAIALFAVFCLGAALAVAPYWGTTTMAQEHGTHHAADGHADGHGEMAEQQGMAGKGAHDGMPGMDGETHEAHEGMAGTGEAAHEGMAEMDKAAHEGHEGMSGMDAEGHDHEAMMAEAEDSGIKVGVDEHLGAYLPMDATFKDSTGAVVTLGEAVNGPTLILPVYYTCPNVCHILQGAMARVLPEVALEPGTELSVLSLSFDENDTPDVAARNKRNFAAALRGGFPAEHWKFLTGDKHQIARTMDALGFRFQRMDEDFAHPVVVVAVAPDGKIVRYLYGSDFLPFDVTMAATEAARGTPGISVKRLLSFCYSYDPGGRRYAFNILRVSGVTVLVSLGLILLVLFTAGKKKRPRRGRREGDG